MGGRPGHGSLSFGVFTCQTSHRFQLTCVEEARCPQMAWKAVYGMVMKNQTLEYLSLASRILLFAAFSACSHFGDHF